MIASRRGFSAAVLLALALTGCKGNEKVTAPLPKAPPAQRTAASFVHCVEAGTSGCVPSGVNVGGADAFLLLSWIAGGSPVGLLEALDRELRAHADPRLVQARFVHEVERYANEIRGAECDSVEQHEIDPLIDKAAAIAEERVKALGLFGGDIRSVISGLAKEAHDEIGGGHLVRLDCARAPYRLYVLTTERDGEYEVVGLATFVPPELGGDVPDRDVVEERLESRALGLSSARAPIVEGAIDPYLPFSVEVF